MFLITESRSGNKNGREDNQRYHPTPPSSRLTQVLRIFGGMESSKTEKQAFSPFTMPMAPSFPLTNTQKLGLNLSREQQGRTPQNHHRLWQTFPPLTRARSLSLWQGRRDGSPKIPGIRESPCNDETGQSVRVNHWAKPAKRFTRGSASGSVLHAHAGSGERGSDH